MGDLLPTIRVIGMEGSGKSALLEALLGGIPLNFTARDRATVAPVSFRVKRTRSLKDGVRYRVSLRFDGIEGVDPLMLSEEGNKNAIAFLRQNLETLMRDIKAKRGHCFKPVYVVIECSGAYFSFVTRTKKKLKISSPLDETCNPITLLDFPGITRGSHDHDEVKSITEKNLAAGPLDIVLMVERADATEGETAELLKMVQKYGIIPPLAFHMKV